MTMIVVLLLLGHAMAQDVIVIDGGMENAGLLEATINGDTTETGERANPDRIYELKAGEYYIINTGITVNNPTGTLTIRGQEGGTKPVIIQQPVEEVEVAPHTIKSNLKLQNVHWQAMSTSGHLVWWVFHIEGNDRRLDVENSFLEFVNGVWWNMNNVPTGAKIFIRNCYFRDMFNGNQWWGSRIVSCKVPVDSLVFENNTCTGGGLLILGQECLFEYALINHNTIINNHKYPFLNQYWKEAYITNNLFINTNWVGEDTVNVATGGQDPDALLMGIAGVDTIENSILIQDKFLNEDSTLTDEVDELSDIIYFASNNVVAYSTELDNYYKGGYNDVGDYPVSYLTWSGIEGPHAVLNVPGIWSNQRTQALVAEWPNIVDENNHIYDMTLDEIGLVTQPITETGADLMAQWNRAMWGVPDASAPVDYTGYWFGDYDPNTIPGKETENGSGIEKFYDLIEDFSISNSLASTIDGHTIGALHWTDEIDTYDPETGLSAIKSAYTNATTAVNTEKSTPENFTLSQNYPNPFNPVTNIAFSLKKKSHVELKVYNQIGQEVVTLVNETRDAGSYDLTWDASVMPTGLYFYTLNAGDVTLTRKMMLIK
jgi:hypothetical protein